MKTLWFRSKSGKKNEVSSGKKRSIYPKSEDLDQNSEKDRQTGKLKIKIEKIGCMKILHDLGRNPEKNWRLRSEIRVSKKSLIKSKKN